MKILIKSIGLVAASVLTVIAAYYVADRYLERFRRSYITIENEYINV